MPFPLTAKQLTQLIRRVVLICIRRVVVNLTCGVRCVVIANGSAQCANTKHTKHARNTLVQWCTWQAVVLHRTARRFSCLGSASIACRFNCALSAVSMARTVFERSLARCTGLAPFCLTRFAAMSSCSAYLSVCLCVYAATVLTITIQLSDSRMCD